MMRTRMGAVCRAATTAWIGMSLGLTGSLARAEQPPLPPAPKYYVLDEARILAPRQSEALGTLLIEHDHATDEQIMVAIFPTLGTQNLAARTAAIFNAWEIGLRAGGNGALLAVYIKEKKARFETGYGMSTQLTDAEAQRTIRDLLWPELDAGHPYRALGLTVIEVLKALQSPLIDSGRALEILHAGGWEGPVAPSAGHRTNWALWVLLGMALLALALSQLVAAEAHFTSEGWFRPKPWRHSLRWVIDLVRSRRPGASAPASPLGGASGSW